MEGPTGIQRDLLLASNICERSIILARYDNPSGPHFCVVKGSDKKSSLVLRVTDFSFFVGHY